jgi:hypothetical protein
MLLIKVPVDQANVLSIPRKSTIAKKKALTASQKVKLSINGKAKQKSILITRLID